MDNEKLVMMVQGGERDKLLELWAQVRRLAWQQARRWRGIGGAETEDLVQAAFIAMMGAADTFDPEAGMKFSSWFCLCVRTEFSEATGQRTKRQRQDPLHHAESLDAPLNSEEEITLGEIIPDPAAEAAVLDVEERDQSEHICAVLLEAVSELPESQRAAVIGRYYRGIPVDPLDHAAALRALRHPRVSRRLMAYR